MMRGTRLLRPDRYVLYVCLDKNGTILGNAKELNALSVLYSSHYQLLPKALKSSGSFDTGGNV